MKRVLLASLAIVVLPLATGQAQDTLLWRYTTTEKISFYRLTSLGHLPPRLARASVRFNFPGSTLGQAFPRLLTPLRTSELHLGPQDSGRRLAAKDQPSVLRPIAGGVLGAAAGAVIGGVWGVLFVTDEPGFEQNPPLVGGAVIMLGFIAGTAIGEPWGAACGVHIGNRRRGHAPAEVAVSATIFAGGIIAAIAAEEPLILLAIPLAQIAALVPIERATAQDEPRRWKICEWP